MARKANKSAAIRDLLKENPTISASDAIAALGKKGIKIHPSMFYTTKGKLMGKKARRKKAKKMVENVTTTMSDNGPAKTSDVIGTILKVKHLASEVGGLKKLRALVEALGE